jgi:hypothetical protein
MIDYGAAKDGYWNANHMLLQVADCFDVWNVLDRMSYLLLLWEFDHSSGHDSEPVQNHYQRFPSQDVLGKGEKHEGVSADGCLHWYNRS